MFSEDHHCILGSSILPHQPCRVDIQFDVGLDKPQPATVRFGRLRLSLAGGVASVKRSCAARSNLTQSTT
jgi:hypothetical protein